MFLHSTRNHDTCGDYGVRGLAQLSDDELIKRVRQCGLGWKSALSVLLQRHRDWILRRCYRRLANNDDAEDATQEILLRTCNGVNRFEGRAQFRTWLTTVVENHCRSYAVRRARYAMSDHVQRTITLMETVRHRSWQEKTELRETVSATFNRVTPHAREVLLLRFFHDLSLEQIADTLGISLSATKMRLYRDPRHEYA